MHSICIDLGNALGSFTLVYLWSYELNAFDAFHGLLYDGGKLRCFHCPWWLVDKTTISFKEMYANNMWEVVSNQQGI